VGDLEHYGAVVQMYYLAFDQTQCDCHRKPERDCDIAPGGGGWGLLAMRRMWRDIVKL
jgi:hypothetical protein